MRWLDIVREVEEFAERKGYPLDMIEVHDVRRVRESWGAVVVLECPPCWCEVDS